jgi:alpha-methylacyl-CoA racemase
MLEGTDACFAPVLQLSEAARHPHLRSRGAFVEVDGVQHTAPAPRFSRTPAAIQGPAPSHAVAAREVLQSWRGA